MCISYFEEGSFLKKLFSQCSVNELDWPAQSPTSSNIFGENRNANCEPSLIAQHQCPNLTKALVAELDQIPAAGSQNLLGSLSKRGGLKAQTYLGYRIKKTWRTRKSKRKRKRKRRMMSDKEGR